MFELGWYEVDRVGDAQGNSRRTLLAGSLDGKLTYRIPLGSLVAGEREGGKEPFAWMDPQVDGIFDERAVVWGRDGHSRVVETVDLHDGSITAIAEAGGAVQVATADSALARVFFITVEESSNRASGLWTQIVAKGSRPLPLTYKFTDQPVSNTFKYRLAASADGSLLAVQANEGPIALIDVAADTSDMVEPGRPMLGFAGRDLLTLGPGASVVAFDPSTLNGRVLAEGVDSAQIVPGTDCLVAVMRIDPNDARGFDIRAVSTSGGSALVYSQPPGELGPLLARPDRTFLKVQLPPYWVLLGDTFFPFIQTIGQPSKNVPDSQYPKLLNMATGETLRLGPFVDEGE